RRDLDEQRQRRDDQAGDQAADHGGASFDRRRLYGEDDLSFHLAIGHQRQGLGSALERKRPRDVWFQLALSVPEAQLLDRFAKALWLAPRELAPEHADDRAAFQQREIERDPRNVAGREADDEQATTPGERSQRRLRIRAAYRIVHDVDAAAAGQRGDLFAQIAGAVIDRFVGAVRAADRELLVARRGGDDARAERLADLDRGDADAAGGAEDQQRLAGDQLAAIAQRVIGCGIGEAERGGGVEVHAARQRQQPPCLGLHFLRERAVGGDRHHAVADRHVRHAVAD